MADVQHGLFALFEQAATTIKPRSKPSSPAERSRRYRERLKARETTAKPITKRCCSCKVEKDHQQFHKSRSERDGLARRCKACKAVEHSARYYRRASNYMPVSSKKCPGCQEVKPAWMFHRQTAASDGLTTYCRECERPRQMVNYEKNRGKRILQSTTWQFRNRALDRSYRIVSRCRKRAAAHDAEGRFTGKEWRELLSYFGHRCAYCLVQEAKPWPFLTADHIVPLSKGGSGWISNIVPACLSCNSSKGGRSLLEFATWQDSS